MSYAWSMLSLNDISIIAVFRLSVTLDDINSFRSGLTFASLLQRRPIAPNLTDPAEIATIPAGNAKKPTLNGHSESYGSRVPSENGARPGPVQSLK